MEITNFEEERVVEIKNDLRNHIVSARVIDDTTTIISFREPGTDNISMRIILDNNYIHTTGNNGEAIFCLPQKATPKYIKDISIEELFKYICCENYAVFNRQNALYELEKNNDNSIYLYEGLKKGLRQSI